MKRIAFVTVGRSDFGIIRPVLSEALSSKALDVRLYVTGAHLSPEYGMTIEEIVDDGFKVHEKVEMTVSSDSPEGLSKSIGLGVIGFSQVLARDKPDLLFITGDRFEMVAATLAAVAMNITICHLHGGERSEGAIDEVFRHCISKMSHFHFATTEEYVKRIIQMGEMPEKVFWTGAPGIDNMNQVELLSQKELELELGLQADCSDCLLVTYHPVTREFKKNRQDLSQLIAALEKTGRHCVITYPNSDTSGREVIEMLEVFAERCDRIHLYKHLGTKRYFSLMQYVRCMVGNSSSGIIEAASFGLPVVNMGNRQKGRAHGENVLHADADAINLDEAISAACSDNFREKVRHMKNPYGEGEAAGKIVAILEGIELDEKTASKEFFDLEFSYGN